jgi:WD40 repeat protein
VAFSPDGTMLATSGDDGRIKIWRFDGRRLTESGTVLRLGGAGYIAFSPDGKTLASASGNGVDLIDVATWGIKGNLPGITGTGYDVGFTADGRTVVSIDSNSRLYRHDTCTMAGLPVISLPSIPWLMGVSPVATATEQWVAVTLQDGNAAIYNIKNATVPQPTIITVTADTSIADDAVFSPDGKLMAAGGDDGILRFWNVPVTANSTGGSIPFMNGTDVIAVNGIAWSGNSQTVSVAAGTAFSGGHVSVNDVATRTQRGRRVPTYWPVSVAYSPNGGAVAGGEISCGKVIVCAD